MEINNSAKFLLPGFCQGSNLRTESFQIKSSRQYNAFSKQLLAENRASELVSCLCHHEGFITNDIVREDQGIEVLAMPLVLLAIIVAHLLVWLSINMLWFGDIVS